MKEIILIICLLFVSYSKTMEINYSNEEERKNYFIELFITIFVILLCWSCIYYTNYSISSKRISNNNFVTKNLKFESGVNKSDSNNNENYSQEQVYDITNMKSNNDENILKQNEISYCKEEKDNESPSEKNVIENSKENEVEKQVSSSPEKILRKSINQSMTLKIKPKHKVI